MSSSRRIFRSLRVSGPLRRSLLAVFSLSLAATALTLPAHAQRRSAAPAAASAAPSSTATTAAPRPLTHDDFDAWRGVFTPIVSRDGRWLAYSYMPQDGDGDVVIRELATGKERRLPVGALLPPAAPAGEEGANPEGPPPAPRNIRLSFSSDSRFLVSTTHPTKADIAQARKDKKTGDQAPKPGLMIVALAGGDPVRIPAIKSFSLPSRGGSWLAYVKEPKPDPATPKPADGTAEPTEKTEEKDLTDSATTTPSDFPYDAQLDADIAYATRVSSSSTSTSELNSPPTDAADAQAPARRTATSAAAGAAAPRKDYGSDLVLRDLATGAERTFDHATDTTFARDGKTLLYTTSTKTETDNGLYAVTPGTDAAPTALLSGKGKYTKLTWDREQSQLVLLSDRDDVAARTPKVKAYLWTRGAATATELTRAETAGPIGDLILSDKGQLAFSRDGKKLYLPAAPAPKRRASSSTSTPAPASTSTSSSTSASTSGGAAAAVADEDKVSADLWRWNDDFVQPMQKVRANQDRNRTYRGVLDLATKHYTQLADPTLATVTLSDDGSRALGIDDRPYRPMVDYDGRFTDIYLVNPTTGARTVIIKQQRSEGGGGLQWSPDGKWASFYQGKQWHLLNTADGKITTLTAKTTFWNDQDDRPEPPSSYGTAGWTKDSASIVVYDKYDVWQLWTDGRARNLTAGSGRSTKVALRVQRTEPIDEDDDERGLDPAKPLYLRGESEETRASGFFKTDYAGKAAPARLLWDDKNFRYVGRAQEADVLLVTASRFDAFPDVHTVDGNFGKLARVTDGASQQKPYAWGSSELISFKGLGGANLQAALYKPANFDPKKKYPLIVYIYERLSQSVNSFVDPRPAQNVNISLYTSNGYIILTPDIIYKTGQPGQSALKCVLPAIDAVAKLGFVDEKNIGIQGHSWGGYQIAYMVTQTNRFRAAEAGAAVVNMTSAYSGIRWGSGLPRQFQYEQTQSRIGKPMHEDLQPYLDNSPIFHITKIQTPLLLLNNDADDAVPWYQGIEFFLGLRRLGKPVWLWSYNGELHGLRRRADQKDYGKRMHQFFDHYLKGAPAPEWMEKGIPYLEKDEEKLRFNAKPGTAPAEAASDLK